VEEGKQRFHLTGWRSPGPEDRSLLSGDLLLATDCSVGLEGQGRAETGGPADGRGKGGRNRLSNQRAGAKFKAWSACDGRGVCPATGSKVDGGRVAETSPRTTGCHPRGRCRPGRGRLPE